MTVTRLMLFVLGINFILCSWHLPVSQMAVGSTGMLGDYISFVERNREELPEYKLNYEGNFSSKKKAGTCYFKNRRYNHAFFDERRVDPNKLATQHISRYCPVSASCCAMNEFKKKKKMVDGNLEQIRTRLMIPLMLADFFVDLPLGQWKIFYHRNQGVLRKFFSIDFTEFYSNIAKLRARREELIKDYMTLLSLQIGPAYNFICDFCSTDYSTKIQIRSSLTALNYDRSSTEQLVKKKLQLTKQLQPLFETLALILDSHNFKNAQARQKSYGFAHMEKLESFLKIAGEKEPKINSLIENFRPGLVEAPVYTFEQILNFILSNEERGSFIPPYEEVSILTIFSKIYDKVDVFSRENSRIHYSEDKVGLRPLSGSFRPDFLKSILGRYFSSSLKIYESNREKTLKVKTKEVIKFELSKTEMSDGGPEIPLSTKAAAISEPKKSSKNGKDTRPSEYVCPNFSFTLETQKVEKESLEKNLKKYCKNIQLECCFHTRLKEVINSLDLERFFEDSVSSFSFMFGRFKKLHLTGINWSSSLGSEVGQQAEQISKQIFEGQAEVFQEFSSLQKRLMKRALDAACGVCDNKNANFFSVIEGSITRATLRAQDLAEFVAFKKEFPLLQRLFTFISLVAKSLYGSEALIPAESISASLTGLSESWIFQNILISSSNIFSQYLFPSDFTLANNLMFANLFNEAALKIKNEASAEDFSIKSQFVSLINNKYKDFPFINLNTVYSFAEEGFSTGEFIYKDYLDEKTKRIDQFFNMYKSVARLAVFVCLALLLVN